jgi:lipopolysaccharide transport system ATP-binding protein
MVLPWQKPKELPTLLHITHIKAGSTWIDALLRRLFGDRVMPRFGSNLFDSPTTATDGAPKSPPYSDMFGAMKYQSGHVYPGLFITYAEFVSRPEFQDARRFVVIRDLRDTLTSHYFSLKGTHALDKLGRVKTAREYLQSASKEDGFLYLIERDLDRLVEIQRSWLAAGELIVRYEDLIRDDVAGFRALFLEKLELPVRARDLDRAVAASRFETVYKRKLGQLDEKSHGRQGLPGDWKNHFPPGARREFHRRAGDLLIAAGYEKDDAWIGTPVQS